MRRPAYCAYGACQHRERPITIKTRAGRPAFCGELHATMYLLDQLRKQAKAAADRFAEANFDDALDHLQEIEDRRQASEEGNAGV